jgi:hypothetical protein
MKIEQYVALHRTYVVQWYPPIYFLIGLKTTVNKADERSEPHNTPIIRISRLFTIEDRVISIP